MPRESKTSQRKVRAQKRRREVLELKIAGHSAPVIGAKLGISKQAVHKHLKKALTIEAKRSDELSEVHRELELQRIEGIIVVLTARLTDPLEPVENFEGEVIGWKDRLPAISDKLLKAIDLRAKLLGLHAPAKTELTGKNGGPVEVKSWSELLARAREGE